ncbi:unnamed protein product [Prunus armeniaca]|uniref:Uncharacterized protein n=1 Tax=Prunus armeniaca TaxID=36596 RepID=A0A6J5VM95_PRUAR|nr:unnamed protein product [Prunus armeniaca]CAB4319615.1 unnamed protein product [Prunus armeniaca]
MEELIENYMLKSKSVGTSNEGSNVVLIDNTLVDTNRVIGLYDETPVLNPSCVRPKGISNARLKPTFEKRKKKTSLSKKIKQPRKGGSSQTSLHAPNYLSMTLPTTNGCFPPSNQNVGWVLQGRGFLVLLGH